MAEQAGGSRRRVSIIGLLFSVAFFAVASAGFTGDPWWLFSEATKWIVAGIVAVVGVGLLLSALPGRRRASATATAERTAAQQ